MTLPAKSVKEIIKGIDDTIRDMHRQEKVLLETKRILQGKPRRRPRKLQVLRETSPPLEDVGADVKTPEPDNAA